MTSETYNAKVIAIGPKRVGKSAICNFIAENNVNTSLTEKYHATVGCRILEFERDVTVVKTSFSKTVKLNVELWDCSGDPKYEICWPAFKKDVMGVLLVCDPKMPQDLDYWYQSFCTDGQVSDRQCLVFAHQILAGQGAAAAKAKVTLSKQMQRLTLAYTSIDSEADRIRIEFDRMLQAVAGAAMDKQEKEEQKILSHK